MHLLGYADPLSIDLHTPNATSKSVLHLYSLLNPSEVGFLPRGHLPNHLAKNTGTSKPRNAPTLPSALCLHVSMATSGGLACKITSKKCANCHVHYFSHL